MVWKKLYRFQRDAMVGAIDKLERLGGCIIADSVGLGKTFEALATIKYYELRNDRVLVLCPKRLRDNWTLYRANDRLMKRIIKTGVKTKVLMLSATPVNNRLADLKNQLAFITEGGDTAFAAHGIPSIEATVRRAQLEFNRWLALEEAERTPTELTERLRFDYFKLPTCSPSRARASTSRSITAPARPVSSRGSTTSRSSRSW